MNFASRKNPLELNRLIRDFLNKNGKYVKISQDESARYRLEDSSRDSSFYFTIGDMRMERGEAQFRCSFLPINVATISPGSYWLNYKQITQKLEHWLVIVREFEVVDHDLSDHFNDPILEGNYEWYRGRVVFTDEDADVCAFNPQEQDLLLENLSQVILLLEEYQEEDNIEQEEVAEMINDLGEIKRSVGKLSKNQILRKIVKVWAKARKYVPEIAQEVVRRTISGPLSRLMGD